MVPASKVSVPLAVVMRTLSRVPPRVTSPAVQDVELVACLVKPLATHIFDPRVVITKEPAKVFAATICPKTKPAVELVELIAVAVE